MNNINIVSKKMAKNYKKNTKKGRQELGTKKRQKVEYKGGRKWQKNYKKKTKNES